VTLTKAELRSRLRAKRLALTPAEVAQKSQIILEKLIQLINWSTISKLHCYTARNNEVDTKKLFEFIWEQQPQIETYTTWLQKGWWQHGKLTKSGFSPLKKKLPQFDVIVVPMLGFDQHLHRLGNGGGYYDRFLAGQPLAQKIGLCYQAGLIDVLPNEPHDVQLDKIIAENKLY